MCVYWNSTTEIFQLLHACTETAPLKYFISYVRVLKVHHRNISEATCLYWNSTPEIFQWLRACTETATLKYFRGCVRVQKLQYWIISGVACVYWNCSTEIFQCLPVCTEIALHYWNCLVCTRVYCNCTTQIFQCEPVSTEIFQCLQLSTELAVLKYFSVNPESITLKLCTELVWRHFLQPKYCKFNLHRLHHVIWTQLLRWQTKFPIMDTTPAHQNIAMMENRSIVLKPKND